MFILVFIQFLIFIFISWTITKLFVGLMRLTLSIASSPNSSGYQIKEVKIPRSYHIFLACRVLSRVVDSLKRILSLSFTLFPRWPEKSTDAPIHRERIRCLQRGWLQRYLYLFAESKLFINNLHILLLKRWKASQPVTPGERSPLSLSWTFSPPHSPLQPTWAPTQTQTTTITTTTITTTTTMTTTSILGTTTTTSTVGTRSCSCRWLGKGQRLEIIRSQQQ